MKVRLDVTERRLLAAYCQLGSIAAAAAAAGITNQVAQERIAHLTKKGVLEGAQPRLNMKVLGLPHEVWVTGTPTGETSKKSLEALAETPGVGRMFTMAAQASVGFTLNGTSVQSLEATAAEIAARAGLHDVQVVLVVNTWTDNPALGASRLL